MKNRNALGGVGAVTQNRGHRIYFTLDKKYAVEIWNSRPNSVEVFDSFDEVLSYLKGEYPDKQTIKIKMEILPGYVGEIAIRYNYHVGEV